MPANTFYTLDSFALPNGQTGRFYSLPKLERAGVGPVSRLPVSIRVVLESVLRNVVSTFFDGSPSRAMAALLGAERALDEDEIERLAQLVENARRKEDA